jgi:O-acetyl-ADP-ribose deacetylase (regulator of RNase III)
VNEWRSRDKTLKIVEGNIALLDVDAVVNAANKRLVLGGGVAGAIRAYGGPSIQEECDRLAPIETGQAVITGAGKLKARHVIHAVGPVYGEGDEEAKLTAAARSALEIARERKLRSVAFPAISAGIYGFPLRRASEILLETALRFLTENDFPTDVVFCLYGRESEHLFEETLDALSLANGG